MHARKVWKITKEKYDEIRAFVLKHPDVETAFVAKHYGLCDTMIQYVRRMSWEEFLTFKEEKRKQYHLRKQRQAASLTEAVEAFGDVSEADQTQMVMPEDLAIENPEKKEPEPVRADDYTLNEYQQDAARTISVRDAREMMTHALYGLASEVGELHGIYQKMYQGHEWNPEHVKRELGDILWMLAEAATAMDWTLGDVARTNIDKLRARYPDGFRAENSLHRRPDDL